VAAIGVLVGACYLRKWCKNRKLKNSEELAARLTALEDESLDEKNPVTSMTEEKIKSGPLLNATHNNTTADRSRVLE
jgi:hypothetical protein